jgi:hypothetical protein
LAYLTSLSLVYLPTGTMFVFARNKSPNYGFCIINRLSIENLVVYLNPNNVNLTMMGDYLIYKIGGKSHQYPTFFNPSFFNVLILKIDSIHGLWMYEQKDRDRLLKCLTR